MARVKIAITRLPHAEGLPLPARETQGAAGFDLIAAVEEASPLGLSPGERRLVPTGLILQLPPGYEGQVRPRSGLAFRHGITVLNAPGTIDADYRGEVQVLLINLGREDFTITRGMRIAQLIVAEVAHADLYETDVISETIRGAGGFGSTGTGRRDGQG
jgi:dUTP pyrophosphatase